MNYLAHARLSPPDPLMTIGNLIADHVRGRLPEAWPSSLTAGVTMHRQTDNYFDHHPRIAAIRQGFPQGVRRFSGIAIDLAFDHWLALNWDAQEDISLEDFQQDISQLLRMHWQYIPNSQQAFMDYLISRQLFVRYQTPESILNTAHRLAQRFKDPEPLIAVTTTLVSSIESYEEVFSDVWQDTQSHFENLP
ncbi:ACP phosphodiesterase [Pleionea sp. CnH1-48]|uniref:acyl carrier protein phosphodiesterase n=1 Tax=Pleionea sp. CnH1-48 TaxID=2954494 RepID=UPI002096C7BD|nr:ACP phosphodiesterase [Pleionea sp. CnH1-48]MCO7225032.1 ACP phosphodiesterase [Pleionea sp. CnH1-48]